MIVGLTGKAGAGKSTVSQYLVDEYGFKLLPLAQPLKEMLWALGVDAHYTHGGKKEEVHPLLNGWTARHAMQTLGTEWGRRCLGDDFWVNLWRQNALAHAKFDVVCDDVRFENEVKMIKSMGGKILNVTRNAATTRLSAHASETAELPFDFSIFNNGTPTQLFFTIDHLVREIQ